jgi:hypothetical protein
MCVGIMSYNGQLNFGLISDYDAVPDLDSLALDLEASIDELSAAVPKPKRTARKAPKRAPVKAGPKKGAAKGGRKTASRGGSRAKA